MLNPDLTAFIFSTYLGGSGAEIAWGLKLDSADRIYVTGFTSSVNYPTFDPIQGSLAGPLDVFISQLNPDGSALEFSSFLGGAGSEFASNGVFVAAPGDIYLTGNTNSGDFVVVEPFQAAIAGSSDAFITRIFSPLEVPVADCTTEAGGCNVTGAHEIQLPAGFVVPPDAIFIINRDDRIDERVINGGLCGVDELMLSINSPNDLLIPSHLCAADADGRFAVLSIDTDIVIRDGTVLNTIFPDAFFENALSCDPVIGGDPQQQDVVVWQTDVKEDLFEGRAIELTSDCGGSSRARTRRVSHFFVGMQINFGIDFDMSPSGVNQAFIDLTSGKLAALQAVTDDAEPVLTEGDHDKLQQMVKNGIKLFDRGNYKGASNKMINFLKFAERAVFDTSGEFNHQGNLLSRGHNIKFMIDVKIIPFVM